MPLSALALHAARGLLWSRRSGNVVSVLIFHRVLEKKDPLRPLEPTVEEFTDIVRYVTRNFAVLPLWDAVERRGSGGAPRHAVAITFDDGYADNFKLALPVLREHGMPATFFVSSGYLDGGVMWNDRVIEAVRAHPGDLLDTADLGLGQLRTGSHQERRVAAKAIISAIKYRSVREREALASLIATAPVTRSVSGLMLTTAELKQLAGDELAEIGGHTVSHPILSSTPADEAYGEIVNGKRALEQKIGREIRCFAYPNGVPEQDYRAEHVAMVAEAGFRLAVSTSPGGINDESERFQLPRFTPWDRKPLRFGLRLIATSRSSGALAAS